jgi:uncharacterized membrane protein YbaN (DUF454 family)
MSSRIITAMTLLSAGLVLIAMIASPFLVVATLTAAFPRWRRWIDQTPRTDEVVARFFDRTTAGVTRRM